MPDRRKRYLIYINRHGGPGYRPCNDDGVWTVRAANSFRTLTRREFGITATGSLRELELAREPS